MGTSCFVNSEEWGRIKKKQMYVIWNLSQIKIHNIPSSSSWGEIKKNRKIPFLNWASQGIFYFKSKHYIFPLSLFLYQLCYLLNCQFGHHVHIFTSYFVVIDAETSTSSQVCKNILIRSASRSTLPRLSFTFSSL